MTQNLTHLGKPYQAEKVENTNIIIEDMGIEITEKAMKQYLLAYMGEENPTPYVRLGVKGGGCSGMSYINEFIQKTDIDAEEDVIFNHQELVFVMDIFSREYLKGLVVDFKSGLQETGFSFTGNKISKKCGCGSSFSA